jgi:3-methyladenine DNA glycosylase AlkD
MTPQELMQKLESMASHDPKDLAGMARFGINVDKAWVVSIPKLRKLAAEIKKATTPEKRHQLALGVWETGVHEAKILSGLMDVPELVTEGQMEKWALDFDSWDVVDMVIGNLFDRTDFAVQKAHEWSKRPEEFVKRAGFVLMAGLATHNKIMPDDIFIEFLDIIERESTDERNFVRKAVNWALRTIGKARNKNLYDKALVLSKKLYASENKVARWIGSDATRELEKEYITDRFK